MRNATAFFLVLLCLSAGAVDKVVPQRRNAVERAHGVVNAAGELTYSVEDGRAVLTIGSEEAGDLVVGDPYALRFAPLRRLAPDEWAVAFGPDVCYGERGEIMFSTTNNMWGWAVDAPRTATILPASPSVALAGIDFGRGGPGNVRKTVSDTGIVLSATPWNAPAPGDFLQTSPVWVSNVVVYAYAGPSREETFDATRNRLTIRDTVGEVSLGDLRAWVLRTYEGRAAEDWSRHPAVSRVRLAGNRLEFNSAGTAWLGMESDGATNALRLVLGFSPVLSLVPGAVDASDALRIWDFDIEDGEAVLFVGADLGVPVGIQAAPALDEPFVEVSGATSSWPETTDVSDGDGVTHPCYRVFLPVDRNAGAAFFRAFARTSASGGHQLRIDNCDLWIAGVKFARETWTFALTNGTTVTRTVLVGESAQ